MHDERVSSVRSRIFQARGEERQELETAAESCQQEDELVDHLITLRIGSKLVGQHLDPGREEVCIHVRVQRLESHRRETWIGRWPWG